MLPQRLEIHIKNNVITEVNLSSKTILYIDGKRFSFGDSFILPGFVDTHCHFLGLGMKLCLVDISLCKSESEVVKRISENQYKRGNWIYGRGWNEENWEIKQLPHKNSLQMQFPNDLVFLTRVDGHSAWVNQNAINFINAELGEEFFNSIDVLKDKINEPTGILLDESMLKVSSLIPDFNSDDYKNFALKSQEACIRAGITEIHDMDVSPEKYKFIQEFDFSESLKIRSNIFISSQNDEWELAQLEPEKNRFSELIGVKYYSDGAIGSRGAAMLEEYSDDSGNYGLLLHEKEKFISQIKKAAMSGYQISTHAIGDRANRFVLDCYEEFRNETKDYETVLRIEHAQNVHPSDVQRFKKINVNPIVQSIHCISDAPMAVKRLGERCSYAYPWKTFIENEIKICGSSDFPIESESVLMGLDAFVNRISFGQTKSFYPKERINISEAFDSYCLNPHLISNIKNRGEIKVGYQPDFVILDNDFSDTSQTSILNTRIFATVVNGKVFENY